MDIQRALAFAASALALTLIPGSDTLLVVRNTVRGGRSHGLATTTGICLGLYVHGTVSALGVALVVRHFPRGFAWIQVAGALYLAFLGMRSLHAAWRGDSPFRLENGPAFDRRSLWSRGFEGFFANVLNPKALFFYAAFLPQFLRPADPPLLTSLLLTSIHWTEGMVWLGAISLLFGRIRGFLARPATSRWLEAGAGTVLLGLAFRLAV